MSITTKRLRMRFRDSNERIVSFTVNPPKLPVNTADVEDFMNEVIATNAFYTWTGGDIVEKLDAALHTDVVDTIADF